MNVSQKLGCLKLTEIVRTDQLYFAQAAMEVFPDSSIYQTLSNAIIGIINSGINLFNYTSNPDDPASQQYYASLKSSVSSCIGEVPDIVSQIPEDAPSGADLSAILETLVLDCEAIQAIITSLEEEN